MKLVKCDGWAADLGCDKECVKQEWLGRYGGKHLCPQCIKRLEDDSAAWRWITG